MITFLESLPEYWFAWDPIEPPKVELMEAIADLTALIRAQSASLERLTEDFVDRRVSAPLLKELGRVYSTLLSLPANEETRALAGGIERFFDSQGIQLISPKPGDPFDPHQHQPIHRQPTDDPTSHGRIARTFTPGLKNERRVVQPARVSVLTQS